MAIGNVRRIASLARQERAMTRTNSGKGSPYVRPYTEFERGGVNRFRSTDLIFRLFRVA
jgi:hypothetical protein